MPDVMGKKLDAAKAAIKDAGFEEDVKVDGGGVFGVVDESNWEVCGQSPGPGKAEPGAPRLEVDRSCVDVEADETPKPDETRAGTTEPDAPESGEPEGGPVLTAGKNEDFAELLVVSDSCDEKIAPFATKYGGRTIKFDGSIADIANHGDYDTRYDILVYRGNKGPEATLGPAFKFEDVNVLDLNLTGADVPESLGEGDRFRFVARVDEYDPKSCLLFLEPVSTTAR